MSVAWIEGCLLPEAVQMDKVANFGDILLALINIRQRTDV